MFGGLLALAGDVTGPDRLSSRRLQHTPFIRSGSPIWVERYGADGYHKCVNQPMGWKQPSRFVVMRIRKDRLGDPHLKLLDSENSVYRVRGPTNRHGRIGSLTTTIRGPTRSISSETPSGKACWRGTPNDRSKGAQGPRPMRISVPAHTILIARLTKLFVAAKSRFHGNRDEVRSSIHEQRAAGLIDVLGYLDRCRKEPSPMR